jgi:Fic family protein
MKTIFDEIDEKAIELKSLLPMQDELQIKLDKKFRLEFNYNSNHIEGNTLTYGETELLLIFDDTKGNHAMREYEEMKAHDVAFQMVGEWASNKEHYLTEKDIKSLNEIILVRPYWKDAVTADGQNTRREIIVGDYKAFPNSARLSNGEIFHYASVTETPILMGELMDWYRGEEEAIHTITLAAMMHFNFVRIHPFDDGNGRIARLLMNYILIKDDFPPVIIKSSDKPNYLRALHLADTGDYEPFIQYIGEQVVWSLDLSIKAARGENIEDVDDIDKEISLFKRSINKTNERQKIKSLTATNDINQNSALPLFECLYKKLASFNELFHSVECRILYFTGGVDNYNVQQRAGGSVLGKVESSKDLTQIMMDKTKDVNFGWIGMEYYLSGFKLDQPFNAGVFVVVTYETYQYAIRASFNFQDMVQGMTKNYDKLLVNDEITDIVTKVARNILEYLQERTPN